MTIVAVYRDDNGDLVEAVNRLRKFEIEVVAHAEEGSVGQYSLEIDDPDASFSIIGHRKIYLKETEAEGDDHGGIFSPVDYAGNHPGRRKGWWEQCEAIRAMQRYVTRHGASDIDPALRASIAFVREHFIDAEYGGWYLNPPGMGGPTDRRTNRRTESLAAGPPLAPAPATPQRRDPAPA